MMNIKEMKVGIKTKNFFPKYLQDLIKVDGVFKDNREHVLNALKSACDAAGNDETSSSIIGRVGGLASGNGKVSNKDWLEIEIRRTEGTVIITEKTKKKEFCEEVDKDVENLDEIKAA